MLGSGCKLGRLRPSHRSNMSMTSFLWVTFAPVVHLLLRQLDADERSAQRTAHLRSRAETPSVTDTHFLAQLAG
jgi:hypothetical protein